MKITKILIAIALNSLLLTSVNAQTQAPIKGINNLIKANYEFLDKSPTFIQHLATDNKPDQLAFCSSLYTFLLSDYLKSPGDFNTDFQRTIILGLTAFSKANKYLEDRKIINKREDFSNIFIRDGVNKVNEYFPVCTKIYQESRNRYIDKSLYGIFLNREYTP